MKKAFSFLLITILLISCQNRQKQEPVAPTHEQTEVIATDTIPVINMEEASEAYITLIRILEKASEKVEQAQTPDEVSAAADWYYDEYFAAKGEHMAEWEKTFTHEEQINYAARDKEFVTLFRERYAELGGTPAQRKEELRRLMIKCVQYNAQLKAQKDSTANATSSH